MLRCIHEAALDRVKVQVFELLQHRCITDDGLRVESLLPHLMGALLLMRGATVRELIEQPGARFDFEQFENPARGVALEIRHDLREGGCGEDGVEMVVEDDPGVDLKALVYAAILECRDEDVAARGGGEGGQPGHDGRGDEVGGGGFPGLVAGAHRGSVGEVQLRGQVRSQVQLGNEKKGN